MRIAICDDDADSLAQTVRMLELALEERGMRAVVGRFGSAEALLAALDAEKPFDMFLLDVIMPGMDGISLGRKIRERQPDSPMLFFSTSRDFAVESYSVEAADYMLKPFTQEVFARAFDRALRRLPEAPTLTLKTAEGFVRVPLKDFSYVESSGRYQVMHAVDGRTFVQNVTMQELWEKLGRDSHFVRVGRQYIVNLAHVTEFGNGKLVIAGEDAHIVVPRRAVPEVRRAFLRFYGM